MFKDGLPFFRLIFYSIIQKSPPPGSVAGHQVLGWSRTCKKICNFVVNVITKMILQIVDTHNKLKKPLLTALAERFLKEN